jgi:hypothetical protein
LFGGTPLGSSHRERAAHRISPSRKTTTTTTNPKLGEFPFLQMLRLHRSIAFHLLEISSSALAARATQNPTTITTLSWARISSHDFLQLTRYALATRRSVHRAFRSFPATPGHHLLVSRWAFTCISPGPQVPKRLCKMRAGGEQDGKLRVLEKHTLFCLISSALRNTFCMEAEKFGKERA